MSALGVAVKATLGEVVTELEEAYSKAWHAEREAFEVVHPDERSQARHEFLVDRTILAADRLYVGRLIRDRLVATVDRYDELAN